MHFALPTASVDLPCTVQNFMAIPAVTANPHTRYTGDAGLPYFDRAAVIANGTWLCGSALKSMGAKLCFRSCLVNIGPSYT